MNCSIAIQILPDVDSKDELIRIVDRVIESIKETGFHYEVGAFETTIEGDFDTLMALIKTLNEVAIEAGCQKVSSYIKTVYAPEKEILTIDEKTKKHRQ